MRADRLLRVPLQVGTSSLSSLVFTAAYFAPGSILLGVPLSVIIWAGITDGGDAIGYILMPGLIVCGLAWKYLLRSFRQRPSDLVFDPTGFTIEGGPLDRTHVGWEQITRVVMERPPKKKEREEDDSDLSQLCVYTGETRLQLAASDRPSEQQSLQELARTLEAGRTKYEEPGQERPLALLLCPHCGAAVSPVDAAQVTCAHCQREVPVPEAVRTQLRDAAAVAGRPDVAVGKLLDQPGAQFLTTLLGASALFMLSAWPVAMGLATLSYLDHALSVQSVGFLLLFVVASVVGFFGLIRGRLVDRRALRLVALDFGAIAPAAPGEPSLCRRCRAALAPQGESIVARCAYCQSENILGIDLRRDATVARKESRSLADALLQRTKERRRWRGVSFVGLAFLGLAVFSLRHGMGHNEKTWPLEQRCATHDLQACDELAELINDDKSEDVKYQPERAAKLDLVGCEANFGRACLRLSVWFRDRYSKHYDVERSRALEKKARELGAIR